MERRSDTYSPATSTHILNILPMIYLQRLGDATSTEQQTGKHSVVLGTVDIKDAFLMIDQEKPMAVSLHNKLYRVKINVPGQRLGAKMWYVDDVMFCGDVGYWENAFLKTQGALQHTPFTVEGHWKRDHFLETQNQKTGRPGSHSRYKSLKGD